MKHLRSLTLKVDITAGTDIREACCDLCELANRVGCLVEGNFNGVKIWAIEGDNPLKLVEAWHRESDSNKTVKIAKSW